MNILCKINFNAHDLKKLVLCEELFSLLLKNRIRGNLCNSLLIEGEMAELTLAVTEEIIKIIQEFNYLM